MQAGVCSSKFVSDASRLSISRRCPSMPAHGPHHCLLNNAVPPVLLAQGLVQSYQELELDTTSALAIRSVYVHRDQVDALKMS